MGLSPMEWLFCITLVLVSGMLFYSRYEDREHEKFLASFDDE